jgi:hypothetical protein
MKIILISANGNGAGKTYLADSFIRGVRFGLAAGVRKELATIWPSFVTRIQSTRQEDKTFILPTGASIRQSLVELGQERCKQDPVYWCKKWLAGVPKDYAPTMNIVVDDLRKLVELQWFRNTFEDVTHFHLKYSDAVAEKNPDGTDVFDDLSEYADYLIYRK